MNARSGDLRMLMAESGADSPARRLRSLLPTALLLRDTVGLLALSFAYLQFYYLDVQLQIMRLPTVVLFPLH